MTKILIVDDEPQIQSVCRRALSGPGVDVETASSGPEALARMSQGWDLILTDLAMPGGVDGVEVLQQASKQGASVIMMSAYPDLGSTLAALHRHAFDYLVKPFSVDELRETVTRWDASRGGRRAQDYRSPEKAARPATLLANTVATCLFADIRGFSRFAATAPAGEVGAALEEVLGPAMDAVRSAGGAVQQVLGDGFLALFGGDAGEAACAAAEAALACRKAVGEVSRRRSLMGKAPLPMGFGLETGTVRAEALGRMERAQPTFVGHSVNLAARLEKAAAGGEILIGPSAALHLLGRHRLEPIAPLELHGFDEPTPAFALLD